MDVQTATALATGPAQAPLTLPPAQEAPAAAKSDGRASADAVASKTDPRPDIPMPAAPSPSQTGLVSKATLKEEDAGPKPENSGISEAQRMLKPYGINMLPEEQDAKRPQTPPEAAPPETTPPVG